MTQPEDQPLQFQKGVGPHRARLLARLGLQTLGDLPRHFPRRHVDRSRLVPIGKLQPGERAGVLGKVVTGEVRRTRFGRSDFVARIEDESGSLRAIFYQQSFLQRVLLPGTPVMLWGVLEEGERVLRGPEYEVVGEEDAEQLHLGRIVPLYPSTAGLSQRSVRSLVRAALERLPAPRECLPKPTLESLGLMGSALAMRQIHFPDSWEELERARTRFVFEEFLALQWALLSRRHRVRRTDAPRLDASAELPARFLAGLPFQLTAAQQHSLRELGPDLGSGHPMQRLLLGDVGSGKTVVALWAATVACAAGYQAAVLAPTEILARQHLDSARRHLSGVGINSGLVVSAMGARERRERLAQLESGELQVVVGTHALLEDRVKFRRLGLAVIDEQHRFGVEQRARLAEKSRGVHQLILTATPIPRTLALAHYGDLDCTVLREKPPGRHPIRTRLSSPRKREAIYEFFAERVAEGRQGYVVYPAVEESDKSTRKAAVRMHEELRKHPLLSRCRIGLAHGKLTSAERQQVMEAFRAGKVDVLVATTVIEVGVDVPNASFMLVEQAELFGLSQLHQLRGRIGRGPWASVFVMVPSEECGHGGRQRLEVLERTEDGFVIAEEDLRLRGPGEIAGTRQSGLPELKLADLARDVRWLEAARREAHRLLELDPALRREEHRELRARLTGSRVARLAETA